MKAYANMLYHILNCGTPVSDRTGTGTVCVFGHQERFNLMQGFPLVTGKKTNFDLVLSELLWFLHGKTDLPSLRQLGGAKKDGTSTIWSEWATMSNHRGDAEAESIGPMYGYTWRNITDTQVKVADESVLSVNQRHFDQLYRTYAALQSTPDTRRALVSAWHVPYLDAGVLNPCHVSFQFRVLPMSPIVKAEWNAYIDRSEGRLPQAMKQAKNYLSLQFYMRSNDVFLGFPFNIASYSVLAMLFANMLGCAYGDVVYQVGDMHIYQNHVEPCHKYLDRPWYDLPELYLADKTWDVGALTPYAFNEFINALKPSDFILHNYQSGPFLGAPVAV